MRKARVMLTICILLLVAIPLLLAQELPAGDSRNSDFRKHFAEVVRLNPQIKDFHKMSEGTVYYLPGNGLGLADDSDFLQAGDTCGIWGREFTKWYGLPYQDFLRGDAPPQNPPQVSNYYYGPPQMEGGDWEKATTGFNWNWILLLVVALLGIFATMMVWLYSRPSSWRPEIPGGVISDEQAGEIMNSRFALTGGRLIQGSQERVRLFGVWGAYHSRFPFPVPHRYNGERAWRARFQMTNGTQRTGIMIQACGNDIAGGTWYRGLMGARVEEGWGEDESSSPTIPNHSNIRRTSSLHPAEVSPESTDGGGIVRIEIRPEDASQQAMVRIIGIEKDKGLTYEENPKGDITIRFNKKR